MSQPALAAPAATARAFAGIDMSQYPGDDLWPWLKVNSPVTWTGAYLAPAPDHRDTGWMTKRAIIEAAGIATVPVFLGQQLTGPGAHPERVNAGQGAFDGTTAAALMRAFGKPPGSFGYLDRETPSTTLFETGYVTAWAKSFAAGGYRPGLYISHLTAGAFAALVPAARIWVYDLVKDHALDDLPSGMPPHAQVWQFAQDQQLHAAGRMMVADFNVSAMADPSAP